MSDEDVRDGNKRKPTRQASRPHKRRRIPLMTEVSGWDSEMFPQLPRLRADFRDLSPTMLDSSSRGNSALRCRRRREEREFRIWRESRRAGSSRLRRDFRDYSPTISSCSGEGSSALWCDGYREERESCTWRRLQWEDRRESCCFSYDSRPDVVEAFDDWGSRNHREDPNSSNEFASRISSSSYTDSPQALRKVASEEEESDVKGRPRIKMKAKKKRQSNFEEEVTTVRTCGGATVIKPCFICQLDKHRAAGCARRICYSCRQPGHLFQRCTNRQQVPLSHTACQGCGREGVVLKECPNYRHLVSALENGVARTP